MNRSTTSEHDNNTRSNPIVSADEDEESHDAGPTDSPTHTVSLKENTEFDMSSVERANWILTKTIDFYLFLEQ